MKVSGDAASTVFKRAAVMSAKITVIANGHAVGDVGVASEHYGPAIPRGRPRSKAPTEAVIYADRDSGIEGQSDSPHNACGRRQHDKAGIGDKQRAPNIPGVVIRNENHGRIHRHDFDQAGFDHDALLGGSDQHLRVLRLQPHRLDRVHHVSGLVVVGIAELRRPSAVFRQVVEGGG
jgi:hypothetical protein